jgi:chemotaxis protein histidine kinase CheA
VGSLRKASRCAHTLRGTSALVKLETVRKIARLLEDLLEHQLNKKQVPGRPKIEFLKRALTSLEAQVNLVRKGQQTNPIAAEELEDAFAHLMQGTVKHTPKSTAVSSQPSPEKKNQEGQDSGQVPETAETVDEGAEEVPVNVCCRFQINQWDLHIPLADMVEIAQLPELCPLPFAPDYVRGLINLRGKVIPIIDLSCAWGSAAADLDQCSVVIAHTPEEDLGFLADRMPHLAPELGGDFFDLALFAQKYGVNLPS